MLKWRRFYVCWMSSSSQKWIKYKSFKYSLRGIWISLGTFSEKGYFSMGFDEMFTSRWVLVFNNASMEMSGCVAHIIRITEITYTTHCWFTIWGLISFGLRYCSIFLLRNIGCNVVSILWLRSAFVAWLHSLMFRLCIELKTNSYSTAIFFIVLFYPFQCLERNNWW